MNRYQDDTHFIDTLHGRLIESILTKRGVDIEFAVLDGAILSEYLVKEILRKFNPLLPYNLAQLQGNHKATAYLLHMGPEDSPEARYDDISVLLKRARELALIDAKSFELLDLIREARNSITHDPRHEIDTLELHNALIEFFVEYSHKFLEYMGIELNNDMKTRLSAVREGVKRQLEERLDNKIRKARAEYEKLSKSEKTARKSINIKLSSQWQDIIIPSMRCPSCYNNSLHYLVEIYETEIGMDSTEYFKCSACGLEMSHFDFDELNTYPAKYTKLNDPDESWGQYYDYFESLVYEDSIQP